MPTCPSCSAENQDTSKFCSECGAALRPEYEQTQTAVHAKSTPETSDSDGSDSSHHGRFLPGTKISNRYRIVSLLGKGGMGEVYRADDLRLGQTVALKFLPKELAEDPKRLELFHNEVRLSRQISHPNVCRVHDIGEVDGQHFLSMEYIDGEDLKSLLRRIGRLPKTKAIETAHQLFAGLAAAHEKGVLHRDLKPANIMIDGRGQVRITDFGLAQLATEHEHEVVGTPAYMAPEQFTRGETSIQSDLYSLGLILYEVFSGEPAHKSSSVAELRELHVEASPTRPPSELVDDMAPAAERLLLQCLENDPRDRPKSAGEAAAILPGGDPLTAAVAAGVTPSPEMIAASGEMAVIPPAKSAILFCVFLAGLATLTMLKNMSRPRLPIDPRVLAGTARDIMEHAGILDKTRSAGSKREGYEYYGFRFSEDPGESSVAQPPVEFWYRCSPKPLTPVRATFPGVPVPRLITLHDPPLLLEGMASVRLSADGKLRELVRVTGAGPISASGDRKITPPTADVWDWTDLLNAAGVPTEQFDQLEPTTSRWGIPFPASSQIAWKALDSAIGGSDVSRVEAACDRGRVVYFQAAANDEQPRQWTVDRNDGETTWGLFAIPIVGEPGEDRAYLFFPLLFFALLVAIRNARRGRCDIRGTRRFGVAVFFLSILTLFCEGSHSTDMRSETLLIALAVSTSAFSAIVACSYYAASEPYARRLWPGSLVTWSRVVVGRWSDPLVGRDMLYGAIVALLFAHVVAAVMAFDAMQVLYPLDALWKTSYGFAQLPRNLLFGLRYCSWLMVFLVFLRIVLKRTWLAYAAALILTVLLVANAAWPESLVLLTVISCLIFLLCRYGLFAVVSFEVVVRSLLRFPVTTDVYLWYAPTAFFLMATGVAWAACGAYLATGGATPNRESLSRGS